VSARRFLFSLKSKLNYAEAIGMYFDSKIYTSVKFNLNWDAGLNNNPFKSFFKSIEGNVYSKDLAKYQFENAIFENPDQDFNELWWKLIRNTCI
jgi:hypothetical protein